MALCSQDMKACPDGSFVSRGGPNCKFAACPSIVEPTFIITCIGSGCSADKMSCESEYTREEFSEKTFKCVKTIYPASPPDPLPPVGSTSLPSPSDPVGSSVPPVSRCIEGEFYVSILGWGKCVINPLPFYGNRPAGDTSDGADSVLRQEIPDCGDGRAILNARTGKYSCSEGGALNRFVPANAHPSGNSVGWECDSGYGVNDSRTGCRFTPSTPARSGANTPTVRQRSGTSFFAE